MLAYCASFVSDAAAQAATAAANATKTAVVIATEGVLNPVLNRVLPERAIPILDEENELDGDVDREWVDGYVEGVISAIEESAAFQKARDEQREAQELAKQREAQELAKQREAQELAKQLKAEELARLNAVKPAPTRKRYDWGFVSRNRLPIGVGLIEITPSVKPAYVKHAPVKPAPVKPAPVDDSDNNPMNMSGWVTEGGVISRKTGKFVPWRKDSLP